MKTSPLRQLVSISGHAHNQGHRAVLPLLCFWAVLALPPSPTMAATFYWRGQSVTSDSIDQNENWSIDAHPSSGDSLYFNNTTGTRHCPYNNFGSGSWFDFIITYSGAGGIRWRGDTTYALKFENYSDSYLFEIEASIGNRLGQDIEINSVGTGGIRIFNAVTITGGKQIKVHGGNTLTFAGNISGASASMAVLEGATVVLSAPASYTGATAIQNGKLVISAGDNQLPTSTSVTLGGSSGNTSGVLQLGNPAGACNQTLAGLGVSGSGSGNRVVGGSANTSVLTISSSGDVDYAGFLGGSDYGNNLELLKDGTGYMTLRKANSFNGGTTIRAGRVYWADVSAFGTGPLTLNDAGTDTRATSLLRTLTGGSPFNKAILVANEGSGVTTIGSDGGSASMTYAGPITLNKSVTLKAGSTGDTSFTGAITGQGGVTIIGTGMLILAAANTYFGETRITTSPIHLKNQNALQNSTLDLSGIGNVYVTSPLGLVLGGLKGTANWSVGLPLTIGNNGQSTAYSGQLQGTMSLTKIGDGTLTLSGASTYSGGTTIQRGTLEVNNPTGSGTGSGSVTVQGTAILGGTGTIAGAVTVQNGGTLAPGASVGTLALNGAPVLNGTVLMEIAKGASPDADKLALTVGTLAYGGILTVNSTGAPLAGGEVFDLFDAPSFNASSSFTTLNLPTLPVQTPALNWFTGKLAVDGTIIVNRAPSAEYKTYTRTRGMTVKIPKADLMAGASDADSGDSASYDGLVSMTSSQGVTVTESGGYYFYIPINDNNDVLQYKVKDTRGGTTTRTITVAVIPSYGVMEIRHDGGGTVTLNFYGIPAYKYYIQRKCGSVGSFEDLSELITTPADGHIVYTDTPGTGCNPAFYRIRSE